MKLRVGAGLAAVALAAVFLLSYMARNDREQVSRAIPPLAESPRNNINPIVLWWQPILPEDKVRSALGHI